MKSAVKTTKRRRHRVSNLFERPVVDNFAGGGGASLGISQALGRDVDLAINHDPLAIEMHTANHPLTAHLVEDVFKVRPKRAMRTRPGLAWFSPDCTHFSSAKGAKPVSKKIRGLAWVAVKWAKENPFDLGILENVREFQTWGPLIPKRDHRGREVRYFERKLGMWLPAMIPDPARMGQTFKRFCTTLHLTRICQNGSNGENVQRVDAPLTTITSKREHCVTAACLARFNHGDKQWSAVDEPLGTVTSQGKKFGLVLAYLVKWYGTAIGAGLDSPLHTQTGKARFSLLAVDADASNLPGVKRSGRFLSRLLQVDPLAGPAPENRKELRARLKAIGKARRTEAAPLGFVVDLARRRGCPAGLAVTKGCLTAIADIGLRMLAARELATAQGFPLDYLLPGASSRAVKFIGNSVPPDMVRALVKANMPEGV